MYNVLAQQQAQYYLSQLEILRSPEIRIEN